jgi:uncharacterized damage-inducible protein DinB
MTLLDRYKEMLEYDHEMNLRQLDLLKNQPENTDALKLMTHLGESKNVWLRRLKNDSPVQLTWTTLPYDEIVSLHKSIGPQWQDYLNSLSDNGLDKTIAYRTSKGDPFENTIGDCIMHVINHGTHHRGQVSMLIRQKGGTPTPMDLIFYIREKQS